MIGRALDLLAGYEGRMRRRYPRLWQLQTIRVVLFVVVGSLLALLAATVGTTVDKRNIPSVDPGYWTILVICLVAAGAWLVRLAWPPRWQQVARPGSAPSFALAALHGVALLLPAYVYGSVLERRIAETIPLQEARLKKAIIRHYLDSREAMNHLALIAYAEVGSDAGKAKDGGKGKGGAIPRTPDPDKPPTKGLYYYAAGDMMRSAIVYSDFKVADWPPIDLFDFLHRRFARIDVLVGAKSFADLREKKPDVDARVEALGKCGAFALLARLANELDFSPEDGQPKWRFVQQQVTAKAVVERLVGMGPFDISAEFENWGRAVSGGKTNFTLSGSPNFISLFPERCPPSIHVSRVRERGRQSRFETSYFRMDLDAPPDQLPEQADAAFQEMVRRIEGAHCCDWPSSSEPSEIDPKAVKKRQSQRDLMGIYPVSQLDKSHLAAVVGAAIDDHARLRRAEETLIAAIVAADAEGADAFSFRDRISAAVVAGAIIVAVMALLVWREVGDRVFTVGVGVVAVVLALISMTGVYSSLRSAVAALGAIALLLGVVTIWSVMRPSVPSLVRVASAVGLMFLPALIVIAYLDLFLACYGAQSFPVVCSQYHAYHLHFAVAALLLLVAVGEGYLALLRRIVVKPR